MFVTFSRLSSALKRALLPVAAVAVLALSVQPGPAAAQPPHGFHRPHPSPAHLAWVAAKMKWTYRNKLLDLINQYRISNGRKALVLDDALTQGAQAHTDWMNSTGKFEHPPNTGGWWENIYWTSGSCDPNACFEKWKKSPGHNANMLQSSASKIGIGVTGSYSTARFK